MFIRVLNKKKGAKTPIFSEKEHVLTIYLKVLFQEGFRNTQFQIAIPDISKMVE